MVNSSVACEPIEKTNRLRLNIFKFGGSCFKNEASFVQSLKIVDHYKNESMIIVCSALNGITDKLIEFGNAAVETGTIKDFWKTVLLEIEKTHKSYVTQLFGADKQVQSRLLEFIQNNLQKLDEFRVKLKENGMIAENSDYVVSFGERLSSFIFTCYLQLKGFNAEFISPDENLIITTSDFGNALPINDITESNVKPRLVPLLTQKKILIIPGFYASNREGKITTLGRGGSDFTTTILGYCLANVFNVNVIFWKDVYGILAANPKVVPNARLLKQISFGEAKELTFLGSKILHPKCLKMAEQRDCSVEIRNFTDPFTPDSTVITKECIISKKSTEIIKGVTAVDQIAMITVESDAMISLPGSAAHIFSLMGHYNININFISQCSSENNITFGTNLENGIKAQKILSQNENYGKFWFNVKLENNVSLLSVVGGGMIHKPGVAGILFTTLGNAGVNIKAIAQGSSEMNITMVIASDDLSRAIKTIYDTFMDGHIPQSISTW